MRIAMIGAGYVGLVSGACFAEFGVDVTVMDLDPAKITALHEGRMPIYEPGLDKLGAENVEAGRLGFTTDLKPAIAGAEAVFCAVGTPTLRGAGHYHPSYVFAQGPDGERYASGTVATVIELQGAVLVGSAR